MITAAEIDKFLVEINLPKEVFAGFEQAKDFVQKTTQQTKSLVTTTTDTVDTVSAAAKSSLEQTLQKADQVSNFTSNAMQTAINNSVSEWLQAHPVVFRLVQLLVWATNHPIWGVVMLLFAFAITWSLIKAISRLIEIAWLSLLQAPFKLGQALLGVSAKSLGKFRGLAVKQIVAQTTETSTLQNSSSELIQKDKQQRLAEISTKLEAIHKEENELLQEVAEILASDKINIEI